MKKLIAILLVCVFAVSLVACGGGEEDESSAAFTASSKSDDSSEASVAESSGTEDSSEASEDSSEISDEVSGDTSDETSDTSSETSSGDKPGEVVYTNKFISWKCETTNGGRTDIRISDATSLPISKFNEDVVDGDTGVFTYAYGKTIKSAGQDYSNFAVIVAEYNHEKFGYLKTKAYNVGKAPADVSIPKDGFVIVIWKDLTDKINAVTSTSNPLFPHGFAVNTGLDSKITKTKTAPKIDGKVSSSEYGKAVWSVKPTNTLVSYAQFEVNNYTSTAEVYMTYDAEYLYLGVVVDTPTHDNAVTASNVGDMWQYTCIQVNVAAYDRDSAYMQEHWDWQVDKKSSDDNMIRQYGFGVNNEGETVTCLWMGAGSRPNSECKVIRENSITTYEAAIKWSDLGADDAPFAPKKGDKIGLAVSFNLGSMKTQFKNITLRDGGGIIGINDWSKTPTITLG